MKQDFIEKIPEKALNTDRHVGVHNLKCKGHLHGRTGGYAHE